MIFHVLSVGTTTGGSSKTVSILAAIMAAGALNVGWEIFKYFRGGQRRKDRAEAAEASMKVATDTQQAPLIRESIALGNFDKALAMQQQLINGLNAQMERDRSAYILAVKIRDDEITELRASVKSRDNRIDELEQELKAIGIRMDQCTRIIKELRAEHDAENRATRA